ncbi:hypothetical protein Poly21_20140 [Allorhodopirellula heiligendammensis]|uniref:Uncharacterized protein n=1 Tax=Allorhodopirellula heiligendammensis TaxID=2714739 RepID=A0A5C6C8V8_9BACT|nr:hypothetical protein Poly21_20140 [Allorhodopirellula heiligendammensis]
MVKVLQERDGLAVQVVQWKLLGLFQIAHYAARITLNERRPGARRFHDDGSVRIPGLLPEINCCGEAARIAIVDGDRNTVACDAFPILRPEVSFDDSGRRKPWCERTIVHKETRASGISTNANLSAGVTATHGVSLWHIA